MDRLDLTTIQELHLCSWRSILSNRRESYCLLRTNREGLRNSFKVSVETNKPPFLIPVITVALCVRSERRLNKTSTSLSDSPETSLEGSALSENRHSFLDSYKGTTPLIGEQI